MKKETLKVEEETKTWYKEKNIKNEISKDNKEMKKDKLKKNGKKEWWRKEWRMKRREKRQKLWRSQEEKQNLRDYGKDLW